MQEPSALGRVVELVRDLRQRCPWDRAQSPASLRTYLIEEVFELDHAIAIEDPAAIKTELGDLLLHVAFQIVLAEETGAFGAEDLTRAVEEKMWRRHPHLFGEGQEGQKGQERQEAEKGRSELEHLSAQEMWERTKLEEHGGARRSVLHGLPPTMPALVMAFRLQERAAAVGFDWSDWSGPLGKVREETDEVAHELTRGESDSAVEAELGDLLFAAVNLARKAGFDPRAALEKANNRFRERFQAVEQLAAERGIEIGRTDLATLDGLWDEVKGRTGG